MAKLSRLNSNIIARAVDGGFFRRYAGTMPAAITDPVPGDNVLVAEHPIGNPSAPAAVNNIITLSDLPSVLALATARETWFRVVAADGTVIWDGTTGRNGYAADGVTPAPGTEYNMNVNNPNVQVNATVDMGDVTFEALASTE